MQTNLLYAEDSSISEFTATVVAVNGNEVALDETAFYPGGGGQPPDLGRFEADDRTWDVTAVRKDDNYVWHTVAGDPPAIGTKLWGLLDWERRFLLMRTHTALHILSAIAFRDYGAVVTGGNMDPGEGRLDFEIQNFSSELAHDMIRKVNHEVAQSRDVNVYMLAREEAFALPDLVRTKTNLIPENVAQVRIVEIVGLDRQADGGTHVSNTDQVGDVTLVKTRSKGATNKRIIISLQP